MAIELGGIPRSTFGVALQRQEFTRRELADELGVSFPSITAALGELISQGLVREVRREQGPRGRASLVYGVAPGAGWVLGLDIGSTQVTCVAQGLDGVERFRDVRGVPRMVEAAGHAAAELIRSALDELGTPHAITIAVNQVVPHRLHLGVPARYPNATRTVELALAGLDLPDEVPISVENNVNCAAVAEHDDGAIHGLANCAYLQVGVGIGLGFFTEGALVRGAAGASGELAQIPLSWDAQIPSPRSAIENRYAAAGMLRRAAEVTAGDAPVSAEVLFALAEQGDAAAQRVMYEHAVAIARIAVAAATVIDPAAIAVGGGLAKNEAFVAMLRTEFLEHLPHIDLRTSQKGTGATVQGAVLIARDLALTTVLGSSHQRLVPRPALWSSSGPDQGAGV